MALNYNQEQRTAEWFRSRLGKITGSKVGVIMKSGRGKNDIFSATAKSYLYQVAGERVLSPGIVNDDEMFAYYIEQTSVTSKAMRFGTEQEENARACYSKITGNDVTEVGLCIHPEIPYYASSPDGVVENGRGCVEIKCPGVSTFVQYAAEIKDGDSLMNVNPEYYYQCQSHMACTGAVYCDFITYCPFVANPIHIVRIERDENIIAAMIERIKLAEGVITELLNNLNSQE